VSAAAPAAVVAAISSLMPASAAADKSTAAGTMPNNPLIFASHLISWLAPPGDKLR
jgi:glutamate-1-semialdehyde aminotransferase